jgi:hypothetical protein
VGAPDPAFPPAPADPAAALPAGPTAASTTDVFAGALRGANQSLPLFSLAGFSALGSAVAEPSLASVAAAPDAPGPPGAPPDAGAPGRGVLPVRSRVASASASPIGVRITTGGMGREPGMLIRIRVVSVVSVLGSSD